MNNDVHVLIVPGWNNSGPTHWQSQWEAYLPRASRVQQSNWTSPTKERWVDTLEKHVRRLPGPVVLVAHSLGCITVAHWAESHDTSKVVGALLVAPADVERSNAPDCLRDFAPIPRQRLPFGAHVIASDNDPYCRSTRALELASDWRTDYKLLKNAGHINADTPLGLWSDGLNILSRYTGNFNAQAVA